MSGHVAKYRVPKEPLGQFIQLYWHFEGGAFPHAKERVLPTGSVAMVFVLPHERVRRYDSRTGRAQGWISSDVFVGAHSRPFVIDTSSQACVMGVQFKPGGAAAFLDEPVRLLTNQHVELDTMFREDATEVHDALREATGAEARFDVLSRVLSARLRAKRAHAAVAPAVSLLDQCAAASSVSAMADELGLSARRFTQIFADAVGLTPKRYARVQRFQRVLRATDGRRNADWANVAASCGYYDQSHLIHEFRSLADCTPSEYLRLGLTGDQRNHMPLP